MFGRAFGIGLASAALLGLGACKDANGPDRDATTAPAVNDAAGRTSTTDDATGAKSVYPAMPPRGRSPDRLNRRGTFARPAGSPTSDSTSPATAPADPSVATPTPSAPADVNAPADSAKDRAPADATMKDATPDSTTAPASPSDATKPADPAKPSATDSTSGTTSPQRSY